MSRAVARGNVGVRACPSGLMAGTYSMGASSSSSMSLSACRMISLVEKVYTAVSRRTNHKKLGGKDRPL